jgi:class 3 adenylate cyclase
MPRLQSKSFDAPDETRTVPNADLRVVHLDEVSVGLAKWSPGWRWSRDLGPIVGTPSCETHHLGYALSGSLEVRTDDGQQIVVNGGSVYEIPPHHDAWVAGDQPFVTVEWTSARIVGLERDTPGERVLATVLFTDIVDSTATLERVGDAAWRELLLAHNARLREVLNVYRGREITTTGDGFLAVFDSATRAVRCGAAMARAARSVGVRIRVGIHTGEVEFIGDNVRGVAVHAAARVLSLAGGDEVIVSETTRALSEGSGLEFEDAGRHELKGFVGAREVFRLSGPGAGQSPTAVGSGAGEQSPMA